MKALFTLFVALLCSLAQAQLLVQRLDGTVVTLDAARLATLPREAVKAESHGKPVEVNGVDLREVLRAAGIAPPDQIRGAALRQVLMASALDGYVVAFAWAELDPALGGRKVFLVTDGLKPEEGPLRLVVPGDARPARWVRQLESLRLISPP